MDWLENRPSSGWLRGIDLRELWSHREVAYSLALRDVKVKYKQAAFGVAWVVLQPLVGVAIFSVVFGELAKLDIDGLPYPVAVFAALTMWTFVSSATLAASGSLVGNAEMVRKIFFPRLLAPISAVLPRLLDLGVSLAALAVFIAISGVTPDVALILTPAWVLAAFLVALAAGSLLAALNVRYRDVGSVAPLAVQFWLFASPVVFPSSLFEGIDRYLFALNPMVGVIDGFRWSLLADAPAPPLADLVSLGSGLVLLVGGLIYFQRTERQFADVI